MILFGDLLEYTQEGLRYNILSFCFLFHVSGFMCLTDSTQGALTNLSSLGQYRASTYMP